MSYSQIGQDLFVLEYFNKIQNGYFVEVGATDGIIFSNSYLLEKDFSWNGICIEPIKTEFYKLTLNRKCLTVNKAAYSKSGLMLDFIKRTDSLISGLKLHHDFDWFKDLPVEEIQKVETETLTDILERLDAPTYIHYLSIDTEGADIEVLKGIDFNKYTFGLINIEHGHKIEVRHEQKSILEKNGYKFLKQNDFDDFYIKEKF